MNSDAELPDSVIELIHANRKIDAIKLLREQRGLGLKEAKHAVEVYARNNPHMLQPSLQPESSVPRLALVAIVIALGYLAYRFLI